MVYVSTTFCATGERQKEGRPGDIEGRPTNEGATDRRTFAMQERKIETNVLRRTPSIPQKLQSGYNFSCSKRHSALSASAPLRL
jgi:hypothetical protein